MRECWHLTRVEPIGKSAVYGHCNRGDEPHEWGPLELDVYPDEHVQAGDRLRQARRALGIGVRAASGMLELRPSELCALERGAMTGDVDAIIDALTTARVEVGDA